MDEFNFIELLRSGASIAPPYGIGDDAALLGDYLITTDISVSGVHFLPDEPVINIITRLFEANLSDIAAMGGKCEAYHALLGIGMSKELDQSALAGTICTICGKYNIKLIGGDTVSSPRAGFISITMIGERGKYLLTRNGAKPGDQVYLSRAVGGARLALEKRLAGYHACDISRPAERTLGAILGEIPGVTSCIDISDGLGRDLGHIASASKVMIDLRADLIPCDEGTEPDFAVSSGEEYALAFTVSPECAQDVINRAGQHIYNIGRVSEGSGVFMDGNDISSAGYEHKI